MVKVAGANDYLFAIVLGFCIAGIVVADIQQDTKECTQPLRKAIPCFDFVQGKEKAPSSDCCKSLETVRNSAPKCLCILMKDSTSPSLGFSLNQTRALELPQLCKVDANISLCPGSSFFAFLILESLIGSNIQFNYGYVLFQLF
eukprot:TRINITY_DN6463_c0_g1_i2.p1 TRINITY_DN6463_c0_g1~~TRINITY_DN6463_c0_g1_i2.p1  ORF type:complete len:144 (-),score=8.17 TRINITY_DN6463_c0_g1_i2:639-1070(-)